MDQCPAIAARMTTTELLERPVSFDTTSRHSNLPLIGFVGDCLDRSGVPCRVSTDPAGRKPNLHVINGARQTWTGHPLTLRHGGKLFACGSCDMKDFVAGCLAAVPDTTSHVGTVEGGASLNMIPECTVLTMEWRLVPDDPPPRQLARRQGWIAETELEACDHFIRRLAHQLLV